MPSTGTETAGASKVKSSVPLMIAGPFGEMTTENVNPLCGKIVAGRIGRPENDRPESTLLMAATHVRLSSRNELYTSKAKTWSVITNPASMLRGIT